MKSSSHSIDSTDRRLGSSGTSKKHGSAFLLTKAKGHETKAHNFESMTEVVAAGGFLCFAGGPVFGPPCGAFAVAGVMYLTYAANNERKKQQAALQAAANEKRKAEAVRQESERRQKEFASKLNDIDKGFKRDWDSGKFMKEYRDPPMPRESRGGRETRVA
jgi:hypothetical protein